MGNRQWRRHNERDSRRIERRKAAARASAEKSEEPRAISVGVSSAVFGVTREGEVVSSVGQLPVELVHILGKNKVFHSSMHNTRQGTWQEWTIMPLEEAKAEGYRPCRICYKDR